MNDQIKIPCLFFRGGTSRGPYFLKSDLPSNINKRDKLLLAVMGSPDIRQIDGLGGAEPVKSKVAIISKSKEKGIDVDYLFAQVKIDEPIVDTKPSCGNMLVAVGPYAIEKGLVKAKNRITKVIIRDVNTGMKIESIVRTPNKKVTYEGNHKIDGVPNSSSPIDLSFIDLIGSQTGKLFPTGKKIDILDGVKFSFVDAAMPVIFFKASDFGVLINDSYSALNANKSLINRMNEIRIKVGEKTGFKNVKKSVIPKIALVLKAKNGDIASRYFMPWNCHPTYAVTGSIALAAACKSENTICSEFYNDYSPKSEIAIEHPGGTLKIKVNVQYKNREIVDLIAFTTRNARLIMSGDVYIKKSILKK
ncbi:MAG: 4-oxalomesaconate tautomerase [Candidatus Fonsibacter sp.]|nr:4-oxalomesaconate tautomerase [Candidatus Fonsibacter sp.]